MNASWRAGLLVFDASKMRDFWIVDEGKQPSTIDRMLRRLDRAQREGLDIDAFAVSPEAAMIAGRAYLVKRREIATVHAYNNDVKALAAVARFYGWETVRWKFLREPRVKRRCLTNEQIAALFAYRHAPETSEEKMHRALLLVGLKTGARASEVASMNVSDLDVARSRIYIRKPAKGGLRRWLPVERWVFSRTRPLLAWLAARPVPAKDADALWTSARAGGKGPAVARRVSPDYLRMCLYRVGDEVGVKVNFNVFRHTRATELLRRGWDLLYIKEYLGHASVKSTEVYGEVHEDDVADLMRRRPGRDFFKD